MKRKIILLLLILVLPILLLGCNDDTTSSGSVGELSLEEIGTNIESGVPYYYGKVKNVGNCTVYNVMLTFSIYESAEKNTIVDTASGFPADLGNIKPGKSATFKAYAFEADTTEDLEHYDMEITFLER